MNWKPTPWIAALLGLLSGPVAMLYVRRPWQALWFLLAGLAVALLDLFGHAAGMHAPFAIAYWIAGPIAAFFYAGSAKEGLRPWYARWYGMLGIVAGAVGGVVAVRTFLYEPYRIPSSAMAPALVRNGVILVEKRPGKLHRGEIVVFDYPRDPSVVYVERLIGLPGDRITYRAKHVLVNGQETRVRQLEDFLDENAEVLSYQQRFLNRLDSVSFETLTDGSMLTEPPQAWNFPMSEPCVRTDEQVECVVPAGHYFMLGDNRDHSNDSRYWGFVRADLVKGRVLKVL
ncbi:signal peptidase I [Pseudoduganella violaceinigra]|uniref:signal peptidase I n=1 Tax=Pseudoduganella violaceinigra TaxID=246602 RepID=UPI0004006BF0|nr:signal peptidase I [Pseudoduganella violaceinigra]